jgi:DNA-binding response OmpR family regulator
MHIRHQSPCPQVAMSTNVPARILIVDDDVHVLHNVKRMLERQGYCVAVHDGGPGCSNVASRFEPDLVLVDVKMPFLSGEAVVSLIGKHVRNAPPTVVLFSALDEFTLQKTATACGADGYISKSDSGLDFARKVATYLLDGRTKRKATEAQSQP